MTDGCGPDCVQSTHANGSNRGPAAMMTMVTRTMLMPTSLVMAVLTIVDNTHTKMTTTQQTNRRNESMEMERVVPTAVAK